MYRSISLRTWCTYEARRFELTFLDESTFLQGVYISQTKYEASISMDDLWHGGSEVGSNPCTLEIVSSFAKTPLRLLARDRIGIIPCSCSSFDSRVTFMTTGCVSCVHPSLLPSPRRSELHHELRMPPFVGSSPKKGGICGVSFPGRGGDGRLSDPSEKTSLS